MSLEETHLEQQRDIGKAFREIADLRGELRELRVTTVGLNGDNGLRSNVKDLYLRIADCEDESVELRARLQHYLDVEREATCHGIAALNERDASASEEEEQVTALQIAKIEAKAAERQQQTANKGILISGIIQVFGLILVAMISKGAI